MASTEIQNRTSGRAKSFDDRLLLIASVGQDEEDLRLDALITDFAERPITASRGRRSEPETERAVLEALRRGFSDLMDERQPGRREVLALLRRHTDRAPAMRAVS